MKKLIPILFMVLLSVSASFAQEKTVKVYSIKTEPNTTSTVTGSLKDGKTLSSLAWASSSSNACFPATQNAKSPAITCCSLPTCRRIR